MTVVNVVGAGALGCMLCARLANAGVKVRLIVKPGSVKHGVVHRAGYKALIRLDDNKCGVEALVDAGIEAEAGSLVVLATKVFDARKALELAGSARKVLLICNGALSLLAREAPPGGPATVSGTTTHGCWERGQFDVVHAGRGRIWTEDPDFDALFRAAGLEPVLLDRAALLDRLWKKLAANAVLNPLTAIHKVKNGLALADVRRQYTARNLCAELALAHNAAMADPTVPTCDAPLAAQDLYEAVLDCATENADNLSSMYQDRKAGRRTEIDALNGWVVDVAAKVGIKTPTHQNIINDLDDWRSDSTPGKRDAARHGS